MLYRLFCAVSAALFVLGAVAAVCGGLYLMFRPKRKEITCAVVRFSANEENAVARISFLLTLTALFSRPHNTVVIAVCAPGAERVAAALKAAFPRERRLRLCGEADLPSVLRDCTEI